MDDNIFELTWTGWSFEDLKRGGVPLAEILARALSHPYDFHVVIGFEDLCYG